MAVCRLLDNLLLTQQILSYNLLLTDYLTPQALYQHFSRSSTLSVPFLTGMLQLYTTPRVRDGPWAPLIFTGLWRVLAIPLDGMRLTAF